MTYRSRRAELTVSATNHTWDQPIPFIDYTQAETETWGIVWDRMEGLWKKYACKEYMVRNDSIIQPEYG
jgi:phenylalanine-4-hydroxylase